MSSNKQSYQTETWISDKNCKTAMDQFGQTRITRPFLSSSTYLLCYQKGWLSLVVSTSSYIHSTMTDKAVHQRGTPYHIVIYTHELVSNQRPKRPVVTTGSF